MSKSVVVLSGGIGSGKSLVADLFENLGVVIVEQDHLSREIVEPGTEALAAIVARFGDKMLTEERTLDRRQLREQVFTNKEDRIWLNQLTHPLINRLTRTRVAEAKSWYAIVVNPLLSGRAPLYDRYLIVDVPVEVQIERTMKRDSIDRELASKMVQSQIPREFRLKLADDVIRNTGSIDDVKRQVDNLHRRYLFQFHE